MYVLKLDFQSANGLVSALVKQICFCTRHEERRLVNLGKRRVTTYKGKDGKLIYLINKNRNK